MNITAEEKLMYQVMKAIYESRIPISFKGSMVLKACLLEAGYTEDIRHTVDIDGNWNSETPPSPEKMIESLQNALDKNDVNLEVRLYRDYGEGRSAGFELVDKETKEAIFSMDIDVNRPMPPIRIYEVEGFLFRGVAPVQMFVDKLSVISSEKVFHRIKDVVDLYYISKVFKFNPFEIEKVLRDSGRTLGNFDDFLHRADDLRHSYDKFRFAGGVNKPPFEEVYDGVKEYIKDMVPREIDCDDLEI